VVPGAGCVAGSGALSLYVSGLVGRQGGGSSWAAQSCVCPQPSSALTQVFFVALLLTDMADLFFYLETQGEGLRMGQLD